MVQTAAEATGSVHQGEAFLVVKYCEPYSRMSRRLFMVVKRSLGLPKSDNEIQEYQVSWPLTWASLYC